MKKRLVTALLALAVLLTQLPAVPAEAAGVGAGEPVAKVGAATEGRRTNNATLTLTGWQSVDDEFQVDYTITNPGEETSSSLFAVLNYSAGPMQAFHPELSSLDAGWELRFFDVTLQPGQTVSTVETEGVTPWQTRIFGQRLLDGEVKMSIIWFANAQQVEAFRRELNWYAQERKSQGTGSKGESYVDTESPGTCGGYTLSYTAHNRDFLSRILENGSPSVVKSETIIPPVAGRFDSVAQLANYRTELRFSQEKGPNAAHLNLAVPLPAGTAIQSMTSGEVMFMPSREDGVSYANSFKTSRVLIKHESGLKLYYYGMKVERFPDEFYADGAFTVTPVTPGRHLGSIAEGYKFSDGIHERNTLLKEPGLYLRIDASEADGFTGSLDTLLATGVLTWTIYSEDPWATGLAPEQCCTAALLADLRAGVTDRDPNRFDTYNQSRMEVKGYVLGEHGGSLLIEFTNHTAGIDAGGCVYMLAGILEAAPPWDAFTTPPDPDKYYPIESKGFHYRLEPGASTEVYLPVNIAISKQIIEASEGSREHWAKLAGAGSPQLIIGRAEDPEEYGDVSNRVLNSSYGSSKKADNIVDFAADFEVLGRRIQFQEMLYDVFGSMLPN